MNSTILIQPMFSLFNSRLSRYVVTLAICGEHPYRKEPEFQMKNGTAIIHVWAKSWNDAVKKATDYKVLSKLEFWSVRVDKVELE